MRDSAVTVFLDTLDACETQDRESSISGHPVLKPVLSLDKGYVTAIERVRERTR